MSLKLVEELQIGQYGSPLKQFQREILLDLILAWGSLDGALTMLVSAYTGEALHEAADRMGKLKGSMKILEIVAILESSELTVDMAKKFKKLKKRYEKHSKPRDRIAHAHCPGYLLSDDQYIVFAVTEREGEEHMAVEAIPLQDMVSAIIFGRMLTTFAVQTAESFDSVRQKNSGA